MDSIKIGYECDCCVEECMNHPNCCKNGGKCRLTFDIKHAKNFGCWEWNGDKCYYEKPAETE